MPRTSSRGDGEEASVSGDALDSYALCGIAMRDVFDSASDTVLRVEPFAANDPIELSSRRVVDFPEPVVLLRSSSRRGAPRPR